MKHENDQDGQLGELTPEQYAQQPNPFEGVGDTATAGNIFAEAPDDESNMFAGEVAKPQTKKKLTKGKIILLAAVAALVALIAAGPLAMRAIGDGLLSAGNYKGAQVCYYLCLGMYGGGQRVAVTKAISAMESGEIEAGVIALLNKDIDVEISYNLNGGEFISADSRDKVLLTDSVGFASLYKARKDNYTFKNWDLAEYDYSSKTDEAFIVKLDAIFEPTVYKIMYADLFSDTTENPVSYTYETESFTLKSPAREGYSFVAWQGTDIEDALPVVVIPQGSSGDRTYIATWNANQYVVSMNPDVANKIKNPVTVTFDAEYELGSLDKRGYTHLGWTEQNFADDNGSGENADEAANAHKYLTGVWQTAKDVSVYPVWQLNHYKLTYDLKGGALKENQTNPAEYTVLSPDISINEPGRTGYSFVGWSANNAKAKKNFVIKNNSVGDIHFKAVWLGNPHTLTLQPKGGQVSSTVVNVRFGNQFTIPTPTRTGYSFQGWYENSKKWNNSGTWDVDRDVTVTASWTANKYTVKFDPKGGSVSEQSRTMTYDATYSSLPTPTRYGYSFQGWYNGDTRVDTTGTWRIASNVTLTAKWQGNPHTVSLDPKGGSVSPYRVNVVFGSDYTLPKPTKKGYSFDGWYEGSTRLASSGTWNKDANVSVTARWSANTYYATVEYGNGKSPTRTPYKYDSPYDLGKPSRTGYTFDGWYNATDRRTMAGSGTWTWDKNLNITAQWEANTYTVYLDGNGGSVSSRSMRVTYGSKYELPTPERVGYDFLGWYEGSTKFAKKGTWSEAENVSLTAKWRRSTYTATFDSNGGTKQSSQDVLYGDGFYLPEPSRAGYRFLGWSNSSVRLNCVTGYLYWEWERNLTFEAEWKAEEYSLYLDAGIGDVSPAYKSVTYGSKYSLPTPSCYGYQFAGWYFDGKKISNSGTWNYTSGGTLTARWTAITE
ncbi:MAG: hypothetical protein E7450_08585 [Ruminococcaceae bacterium]|nr:hypothetical protein [Oscillospiraceae bacterium]